MQFLQKLQQNVLWLQTDNIILKLIWRGGIFHSNGGWGEGGKSEGGKVAGEGGAESSVRVGVLRPRGSVQRKRDCAQLGSQGGQDGTVCLAAGAPG